MSNSIDKDCSFEQDGFWFRYRAAAIIIEEDCVLMAYNNIDDYYYSIGGGVHLGETSADAVTREVKEETGIAYEVERLAFVNESLFHGDGTLEGKECHGIELYYLMKPKNVQQVCNGSCTGVTTYNAKEYVRWIPIKDLGNYKIFPEFFKDKLLNIPLGIEHFISDERMNDAELPFHIRRAKNREL